MEKIMSDLSDKLNNLITQFEGHKTDCRNHKNESDRRHTEIYQRVDALGEKYNAKIESLEKHKVSFKHFNWVMGVLITLLIGGCGYMISLIKSVHDLSYENQKVSYETQKDVAVTANDVLIIKKIFENSNIKFEP